jgi:hypothetical protein
MEGRHAESVRYLKSENAASFKRCKFVCVLALCDWLVLLRGAAMPVAHLRLGPDTTERFPVLLPFTFLIDYLLSEPGILLYMSTDRFNGLCFISNRPVQIFSTLRVTFSRY